MSRFLRKWLIARKSANLFLVLGLGVTILASFAAAYLHRMDNDGIKAVRFDAIADQIPDQLRRRFRAYEFGLRGARGAVIAAGGELSRDKFRSYASANTKSRNLESEFPGFLGSRGFGFTRIVPHDRTEAFLRSASQDSGSDFKIKELGPQTGDRFVIQYLEPESKAAIGFDISSEPSRREAAVAAMESGAARLTAPITFAQASGEFSKNFLFLLPVYDSNLPVDTPEHRRAAAIGWSFTPLVLDEVLDALHLTTDEFALSIADITSSEGRPFYVTPNVEPAGVGALSKRLHLNFYGRAWEISVWTLPSFLQRLHLVSPVLTGSLVLALGLLLTGLLNLYFGGLRRKEQAWLQRSRLAAIVEQSSEAIIGTTLSGEVTDWNSAAEEIFGYTASEALGQKLDALIVPPERAEERAEAFERMFETNARVRLTTQRRSRDGRLLDMVVNLSPIRSERNELVGIGTSARDITPFVETQRQIQALNESLEQQVIKRTAELKIVTDAIPGLIAYWDRDLLCRFANKACVDFFGREPERLIGMSMVSLLGEQIFADSQLYIKAVMSGQTQNFQRPLTRPDGTIFHAWTNYVPHFNEFREVLGFFVLVTDVTPLWDAERRIEDSEARYRLLANNSSDMIFRLDRDLVRRYVSPACKDILGYEADELVGIKPSNQIHPDDVQQVKRTYAQLLDGTAAHGVVVNRIRHREGHWIWVEATLSAVKDFDTDEVEGIIGALRDVTERKAIEMELIAAKDAAEAAARAKAEFLASMSHELRTPLNAIIGFSRLIFESPEQKGDPVERHSKIIHHASTALLSIVNDILDVSKLEAGHLDLDCRPFSCKHVFENTVELLKTEASTKGVGLHLIMAQDVPPSLVGDDSRIKQILLNLVANALKFTSKGEVSVLVTVSAIEADKARLSVVVRDTGIGISEAARPRIFRKFSQADSSTARTYGGTGLGLSICKNLVELMGGTIGFNSKEGEGSEFWFTLDLLVGDLASIASIAESDVADLGEDSQAKILLAEDYPINQELAVTIMTKWGHVIDVVSNGAEAIEAVRQKDYDLVLMDVQMPLMDGVEATSRIRALGGKYLELPIIAMTAAVLTDQVERFRQAGMNDHIGKPFEPRKLRQMINYWKNTKAGLSSAPEASSLVTARALPPAATEDAPVLDEAVYAELADMLGLEAAASLALRLADDLLARFDADHGQDDLKLNAHTVSSSAGMLGLMELSKRAKALERAFDSSGDLDDCKSKFFSARERAVKIISKRFGA